MLKPKILDKKTLWEGQFLRVVGIEFHNGHGKTFLWEAIERRNVDGIVAVVPVTSDNNIIVLKQFRPPLGRYVIEFPAGLNDRGEPVEEVARRELLEETGYVAEKLDFLIDAPLSSGASTEKMDVFVATGCRKTAEQDLEEVELIEVIEIPMRDFYKTFLSLRASDIILDPKVPGLIEIARIKGFIK
ncbi:MAG: NUDIX hydrolase [Nitrospirae bacterium]|nr:MAG: NUDIX hydrolase [Nitrospirota bacterium]